MAREKRKHKRYIFPNDEKLTVDIRLPGKNGTVQARLLNVSEGGLGLAAMKEQVSGIKVDSEFLIESLQGVIQLQCLQEVRVKVRWVVDHKPLENLGIGCEFINLQESGRAEISKMVEEVK